MLKNVHSHAKKAASKAQKQAKRKDRRSRFAKKKLSKLRSKAKSAIKHSSSSSNLTQTGSDDKLHSPDRTIDSKSLVYPYCRFMEDPFGALFIPPSLPRETSSTNVNKTTTSR